MRTIVIGDIHGCSKALRALIETIEPRGDDRLIFLGDYVDRGPDSKGVLDQLLEIEQRHDAVFLLGNHEIMFRGALRGLCPTHWLLSGGRQTITSYGGLLDGVPSAHQALLERCRPYWETDDALFVHANYLAHLPLAQQSEESLFWEHLGDRFPQPHVSGKHVYCGHTPQPGGNIGFYGYLTCLDTCCFGGYWLSAIAIESREVWQVSREGHLRQRWAPVRRVWAHCSQFILPRLPILRRSRG